MSLQRDVAVPGTARRAGAVRSSQVMLSKGFGGAERYFVDLVRALARRGHSVQAIVQKGSEAARRLADIAVERREVRVLGAWDPWASRSIRRAINDFAPDIVHGHLARGTCLGGRAAAALGRPMVTKLHNYVNLKYYRDVSRFNVTTTRQRRFLLDHGIAADRIEVIPNFSSLPARARSGFDAGEGSRSGTVQRAPDFGSDHWVSMGRFVPKKGFDVLIDAFAQVARERPGLRLSIGGDGAERAALEKRISALGLDDQIFLPGWVDDVATFLDEADGFVLPSLDEPFGIVVIEAMARGLPIVATRTDGPSEILDEETGWLCGIGDDADLARALEAAVSDRAARAARAAAAQQRYHERYHEEAVLPRILAFYQAACADPERADAPPGRR